MIVYDTQPRPKRPDDPLRDVSYVSIHYLIRDHVPHGKVERKERSILDCSVFRAVD